jgi:hypothetical protein
MWRALRQLHLRLERLPGAQAALVVGLAIFALLFILFIATDDSLATAAGEAGFWAVLAAVAALGGRLLGARRPPRGPTHLQ